MPNSASFGSLPELFIRPDAEARKNKGGGRESEQTFLSKTVGPFVEHPVENAQPVGTGQMVKKRGEGGKSSQMRVKLPKIQYTYLCYGVHISKR